MRFIYGATSKRQRGFSIGQRRFKQSSNSRRTSSGPSGHPDAGIRVIDRSGGSYPRYFKELGMQIENELHPGRWLARRAESKAWRTSTRKHEQRGIGCIPGPISGSRCSWRHLDFGDINQARMIGRSEQRRWHQPVIFCIGISGRRLRWTSR